MGHQRVSHEVVRGPVQATPTAHPARPEEDAASEPTAGMKGPLVRVGSKGARCLHSDTEKPGSSFESQRCVTATRGLRGGTPEASQTQTKGTRACNVEFVKL